MQRTNIMKCSMKCMRMYSTARRAPMNQASDADAAKWVPVHVPCSIPEIFMAVDMAHKNSVIAKHGKLTSIERLSAMRVSERESICQGHPVHKEGYRST